MKRSWPARLAIYAILLVGAVVFSFPFVWMMASSVKVDRELFTPELRVLPQQPLPRPVSPYYEERRLSGLPGEGGEWRDTVLTGLQALVRERDPGLPEAAIAPLAEESLARLEQRAPSAIFRGPADRLLDYARNDITPDRVAEMSRRLRREFRLGSIRVRSTKLQDVELLKDLPPAQRWRNASPEVVALTDGTEGGLRHANVAYDLSRGDGTFTLTADAPLPFDGRDLQRLQLKLNPDDTWHDVHATLEFAGRTYRPERPTPLGNIDWTTLTWQHPGPDDHSTKIKSWLVLRDIGPSEVTGPRVRLTVTVHQASELRAGYSKFISNYRRVADNIPFWRYVRVSMFLVLANIALTLLASSLVAYAFARLNWPGREFCFMLMLGTMMIPGQVTMIPHFLIWKEAGAYNTLTPMWLGAAFGSAFFIFLLRQFMKGIPRDLEDAARIDGCGFLRIYWHVILPLIKPSLAAIAIFTFIGTWNDFMGPLLYIADQRLYPLAFGLYAFSVQVQNNPTLTMAASVLMTLPVIALFFVAQRYFIQGVTLTGMKG